MIDYIKPGHFPRLQHPGRAELTKTLQKSKNMQPQIQLANMPHSLLCPRFSILASLLSLFYSRFSTLASLFSILYSLFAILYSLFSLLYSLFSIRYSLFSILYSLFSILYSLFSRYSNLYSLESHYLIRRQGPRRQLIQGTDLYPFD